MIELLMVILLVALLGAVALPQFLDFRKEGKKAAVQSILNSVRIGIKNQLLQMKLVGCQGSRTSEYMLNHNDVTYNGLGCSSSLIPNVAERQFIDDAAGIPSNPFTNLSTVSDCGTHPDPCFSSIDAYSTASVKVGWCHDFTTGSFWAATTQESACSL